MPVAAGAKETATGVGFAGYTTFEEVTKDICSSTSIPIGTEGRLIDSRDGKAYWVTKLKDGLCWMTQNLDYDNYGVAAASFTNGTQNTAQYYDPGDYVYTLESGTNSCSPNTSTGLSGCTSKGWKNVGNLAMYAAGATWSYNSDPDFYSATSYTSTDGKMICTKQADSYFGDITSDYIPCRMYQYETYSGDESELHYHAGNYYNWTAATNDTGSSVISDGANASGSICPAGWSLPTSNNTNIGSFGGLLSGLSNGTDITIAPYYFVYGGYVYSSTLTNAGNNGYYWSATAYNSLNAYALHFNSSGLYPSNGSTRYFGHSVRCVAR